MAGWTALLPYMGCKGTASTSNLSPTEWIRSKTPRNRMATRTDGTQSCWFGKPGCTCGDWTVAKWAKMASRPWKVADNPVTESSRESESEAKLLKTVLCTAQTEQLEADSFDRLPERNRLRTFLRVTALVIRFTRNCRAVQKSSGVLSTSACKTEVEQNHSTRRRKKASIYNLIRKACRSVEKE